MHLVKENDVYKRERKDKYSNEEIITFKHPVKKAHKKESYDWYLAVALEKSDKVKDDRHLLTSELLLEYRWAIREGYNHELDSALQKSYDHPRNRNTVKGIQNYIRKIEKASEAEMNY